MNAHKHTFVTVYNLDNHEDDRRGDLKRGADGGIFADETQGKCANCKIRYIWPLKSGPLKRAICPECSSYLEQTTYRCEFKWKVKTPKFLSHDPQFKMKIIPRKR